MIVGGGLHALSIVRALADRHGITDVAVVDAHGVLSEGAPPLLRLKDAVPAYLDMYPKALREWRRIAGLRRRRAGGHVLLAHGEDSAAAYRFQAHLAGAVGSRSVPLDRDDLRRLCPGLSLFDGTRLAVREGTYFRDAALLPMESILRRMAGSAVRRGCHLLAGVTPIRLRTVAGRVSGIETSHGVIHAERVLLNGPAIAMGMTAAVGLPLHLDWVDRIKTLPFAPWLMPSVASEALGVEIWQDAEGAVTIMGAAAAAQAVALFPALAAAAVAQRRRVPRERTPDGLPIVGPCDPDGLLVNAAWGDATVWAAPVAAAMLADALAGDAAALPPAFSSRRFGAGCRTAA
ncbi:MAG: NAD(P)/FAD-dependent oxidoreductase [Alphaproteobacteria bacterium]